MANMFIKKKKEEPVVPPSVLVLRAGVKREVSLELGNELGYTITLIVPGVSCDVVDWLMQSIGDDGFVDLSVGRFDGKAGSKDNS